MTKSDFLKWFDDFVKQKQGFYPKDINAWYDEIIKKEKLYLEKYPKTIDIEIPDTDKCIEDTKVRSFYLDILAKIPNYMRTYYFNHSIFYRPTIDHGDYKGMSVAKHILTYCKRANVSKDSLLKINNALSHMGQLWAEIKFAKMSVKATIETSPLAWCLLGLYLCDRNSCFAQGKTQNPDKKYAFGIDPNVFLVLFHNEDIHLKENTSTITGRMILVMHNGFHFTNGYKFGTRSNIASFCEEIYKQLTGETTCSVQRNIFSWSGGLTYTDGPLISINCKNQLIRYNLVQQFAKERGLI